MRFQVRFSEKAEQDVDVVLTWFREKSASSAAEKWFSRLLVLISKLESMPERCGLAAEAQGLRREVRELHFGKRQGTYRLLFEIRGRTVQVLHVWHSARDAITRDDLE